MKKFKTWYTKAIEAARMSYEDALRVFGFPLGSHPTLEQVKFRYRELSKTKHPDAGGSNAEFSEINNANEVLSNIKPFSNSRNQRSDDPVSRGYGPSKSQPPWQTDPRSSYNGISSESYSNLNFCLKDIYEYSMMKKGSVSDYSF